MCCGPQPARGPTEPLSSIACRKLWETVGLTSPAQASHSAAGISAIAAWTRTVTASPVSFIVVIVPPGSAQLEGAFDFDRDPARQRSDPDRGAGVLPGIAEDLDHDIGGAVDDLRHAAELRRAVDEAAEPQHAADAVEIAAGCGARLRQHVEG